MIIIKCSNCQKEVYGYINPTNCKNIKAAHFKPLKDDILPPLPYEKIRCPYCSSFAIMEDIDRAYREQKLGEKK